MNRFLFLIFSPAPMLSLCSTVARAETPPYPTALHRALSKGALEMISA